MTKRETRAQGVECPRCQSEPGTPCASDWTGRPRFAHEERFDMASTADDFVCRACGGLDVRGERLCEPCGRRT